MASSLYGESRRKYSWWWDSHISPKNSKWLQDNLTDMDRNVKAMIKLIEEDADSFAKRAEMYYKKRPELMKIVEEFYRAYRALAERYDHATGALRQAHKTMAEAFPNQIPPMMSDDSPSSITEFYPVSPEMSSPIRGFLDFDDSSSNKKGLKQLKEMFPSNEGSVKKALSFKEEEDGFKSEMKHLKEEISQLSLKNENLMREMTLESQHARDLQEIIYECESGKQDALCRYKNSIERTSILESSISNTRHELNGVSDHMTAQLNSIEEQFLAMESVSRSVRLKLETQQKELNKKALELEELCVVIDNEQEKRLQAEGALMSLEQMHIHSQDENEQLSLEAQCVTEKLKDMEASKAVLEERINEYNVIISNLQEQKISYDAKIKDMQNEMQLLKAAKEKLEYELSLNIEENKALRKEVNGLENSLSSANIEIEGLKVSSNALEAFCETLVSEISTHSVEKGVLVSHMENISDHMESLEVKNSFLENSLSDAIMELENLKARFKDMEESCMSLCDKNTTLLSEKNNLVSQVENLDSKYLKLHNQYSNVEKERDSKIQELLDLQSSLSREKKEQDAVVSSMSSQLEILHNQISYLKIDLEMEQNKFMNSSLGCFILQNCLRDMKDELLFLFGEHQSALEASTCAENQISCLKHAEFNLKRELASLMERNRELNEGFHLLMDALNINAKNRTVDKGFVQSILDKIRNTLDSVTEFRDENGKLHLKVEKLDNLYLELLDTHSNLMKEKDATSHQLIELQKTLIQEKEHYENLVSKLEEEINCSAENIRVEQQNVMNSLYEVFVLQSCLCDMKDTNLSLLGERHDILEEYKSAKNQIVELKNKEIFQIRELETLSASNAVLHKGIGLLLEELNVDVNDMNAKGTSNELTLQNIVGEIKNLKNSVSNFQDENKQLHLKVGNLDSYCLELLDKHFNLQRDKDAITHQLLELQTSLIQQKEHHETLLSTLNEEINHSVENIEVEQQKVMHYLFENFVLQRCLCEMKDTNLCLLRERCDILDASRQAENIITELKNKELLKISEIETLSEHNVVLHKGICMLLEELNVDLNAINIESTIDEMTLQNILGEVKNLKISVSEFRDENKQLQLKINNLESNLSALHEEHINLEREKYFLQNHVQLVQKEYQDIDRDFEMEQQRTTNADIENLVLQGCIHDMCDKNLFLSDKCDLEDLNHKKELNLIFEALKIDIQNVTMGDPINKVTLQTILSKIKNLASYMSDAHDENQCLSIEKLVFGTILNQIRLDKLHLFNELKHRTLELCSSESKRNELMEMNVELNIENDNFLSQIEVLRESMEILETKCLELEDERSVRKTENEELECSLKYTVNEHRTLILSSKNQLAYLETQLHKLQKEMIDKEVELCSESERLHLEVSIFITVLKQISFDKLQLHNELENKMATILDYESGNLVLMKTIKQSKVKSTGQDLEILKRQYSELEIKTMNLENENEVLENSLKLEKQGHSAFVSSRKSQISCLENQVDLVQKERLTLEDELLTEQQKTMNALLENFILQRCLIYTKDTNLALSGEYQNLLEAFRCSDKLILELKHELESQTIDLAMLKRQNLKLEEKVMNLEMETEFLEKSLELEKQGHKALISSSKSQISSLENLVDLVQKEKTTLEDDLLAEQQRTMNALFENFILQRCLVDIEHTNLTLSAEYQNLKRQHSELEEMTMKLERENEDLEKSLKLEKEEHKDLISSSKSQISTLENQVDLIQKERMTLEDESLAEQLKTMNVLFENFILQRCLVDTNGTNLALSGEYQNLKRQYSELEEKTMKLEKKNEDLEKFLKLEMQGHNALISSSQSQISTLENQVDLVQKERMTLEDELLAGQQKTVYALLDNFILQRCLVDTKNTNLALFGEYQNLLEASRCLDKLILEQKHELESQTIELLSAQNQRNEAEKIIQKANTEIEILSKELTKLHNYNKNLETEVCKLREEKHFSLARLETLETENSVILAEAMNLEQLSIFFKSVSVERGFKLKFASNLANDLNKMIEIKKNMLTQKEMEISEFQKENDKLNENLETANLVKMELENEIRALSSCLLSKDEHMVKCEGEINTLLSDCSMSVLSTSAFEDKVYELIEECERLDFLSILHEEKLREQIALNNLLEKKLESLERENDELKADLKSSFDVIACIEEHVISLANLSGLQDDSLMVITEEKEGIDDPHKWIIKAKLLQKVIEDVHYLLELERSDSKAKIESLKEEIEELKLKKSPFREFSKDKYTQTIKDIQLDQASHSYKVSNNESDDQMLELWEENTEDDIAEEIKSEYPSCELNVDKQETFARVHDNESPRAWSKTCNKKLNSDLNKLLMIQKNLQEYKIKLESLEKKKHLKSVEYSNLKEHIQDAEMAISEQIDIYGSLIDKVEENFESSNAVLWEKERRLISEQARKGSVKIEKLESELQKIEYLVLKVQEEEENKRKMYLERKSSSTLLSEFIYSEDEVKGKKKGRFCRCIRPKTKK